jgi:hypothetical protein
MLQTTKCLLFFMLAIQFVSVHSMPRPQDNRAVTLQRLTVERNNKLILAGIYALGGIGLRESPWNEGPCPCPTQQACVKNLASLYALGIAASLATSAAYTECLIIWQHS